MAADASEATALAAAIKRPVMVMKELRQTERAYLDSLLFLEEHYIPQIHKVLPDMVERIFLGVERIIPMHQKLYAAFEAVDLDAVDTLHALELSLDKFVGAFIEQEKSFGIYSSYINAFEQSRGDVVELMQVPVFASTVLRVEQMPEAKGNNLSSFLIKPVQRLPRYILLLQEIKKMCEKGGVSLGRVTDAVDALKSIGEQVNERKRHSESFNEVLRIQRCLQHRNEPVAAFKDIPSISAPERRIMGSCWALLKTDVGIGAAVVRFILFSDALLLATPDRKKSGLVCEHIIPLHTCESFTHAGPDAATKSMLEVDMAASVALYAADDSPPPPPLSTCLQFTYTVLPAPNRLLESSGTVQPVKHVAVSVTILVPLHLEGHQGAVGLCTGKPILDIFLKDTSHIYSPPAIPPMPVSEPIPAGEAGQSRYNCLTIGYNYLSSLQRTTIFIDGSAEKKVAVFGGLAHKFSPRYLALLATGQLLIYCDKDDFDARKSPEDTISLEGVSVQKVNKSGAQDNKGPQYLELFQPFKGNIELGFRNDVAQRIWYDCIAQLQAHLKRIDEQKAKLGGAEGKVSEHALSQDYHPTADMIKWGWMRKKGSDRRNWSDRWVILNKSGELKYYKTPQDTNCQGSLNVLEYKLSDGSLWYQKNPSKKAKHPLIIMLTPSNHSVSMRDYLFELKSQAELDSWTAELAKVQEKGDELSKSRREGSNQNESHLDTMRRSSTLEAGTVLSRGSSLRFRSDTVMSESSRSDATFDPYAGVVSLLNSLGCAHLLQAFKDRSCTDELAKDLKADELVKTFGLAPIKAQEFVKYCDERKAMNDSSSIAQEVQAQFDYFRIYENRWRSDDARLVLAYDTLQMWFEYSQHLIAELKASEQMLKTSLMHRTCNEYNQIEQRIQTLSLSLDWESASPVPVKAAQDTNPSASITAGLFTPGYAFAELLKAKQAVVQSNLQEVVTWSKELKSRITNLKPVLFDKQQVNFKKIFQVFEDSRSKMAQTYLDVKKARELFSACELELKLASKGSISASTLSDKMLKMNAARDKMRQEEEQYAALQRQLAGRYGQCVADIKALLSGTPSSTDELLRDLSPWMTSALTKLLNIESQGSKLHLEQMARTSELIAEKKPSLKDFSQQLAQTVLPQRAQQLQSLHPGEIDHGESSSEEESEEENDPLPPRRKTQDVFAAAVTAFKAPLNKGGGGGGGASADAAAPPPPPSLPKRQLPPTPVDSAGQASAAHVPSADVSNRAVSSNQPTQPPPPPPPRGTAAVGAENATTQSATQLLGQNDASKQLQDGERESPPPPLQHQHQQQHQQQHQPQEQEKHQHQQQQQQHQHLQQGQQDQQQEQQEQEQEQQQQEQEQQQHERNRPPVPPRPASNSHAVSDQPPAAASPQTSPSPHEPDNAESNSSSNSSSSSSSSSPASKWGSVRKSVSHIIQPSASSPSAQASPSNPATRAAASSISGPPRPVSITVSAPVCREYEDHNNNRFEPPEKARCKHCKHLKTEHSSN